MGKQQIAWLALGKVSMETHGSHKSILISTSLMGGKQVIRLTIGVVQSKAVAVLLGTAGTGAFGVYSSVLNLVQNVFGAGLTGSAVRYIAKAHGNKDDHELGKTIKVQMLCNILLGGLGGLFMIVFRRQLSVWTFGDTSHVRSMVYLGISLLVNLPTAGMLATIQGVRRIGWLALAHILGSAGAACVTVLLIYFYREAGIAPAFLATALCSWGPAWWYYRACRPRSKRFDFGERLALVRPLFRLGIGFMSSSLIGAVTAYILRAFIAQSLGLSVAGIYQAAWMIATFYSGIILHSMGTDFLPRISAVHDDRMAFNRLVNEQAEVGLILVIPGLLLSMVATPLLIRVLYSGDFLPATSLARWMLAGTMVRAMTWPLAYVPLALNRPGVMVIAELLFGAVLLGASFWGIRLFGVDGVGIGYFVASFSYPLVLIRLARSLTGFRWSTHAFRLIGILYCVALSVWLLLTLEAGLWGMIVAYVLTGGMGLLAAWYAFRTLFHRAT